MTTRRKARAGKGVQASRAKGSAQPRRAGGSRVNQTLHAVILAGGAGERFWPASRRHHPKPFLKVIEGRSLLDATLERLLEMFEGALVLTVPEQHPAEGTVECRRRFRIELLCFLHDGQGLGVPT